MTSRRRGGNTQGRWQNWLQIISTKQSVTVLPGIRSTRCHREQTNDTPAKPRSTHKECFHTHLNLFPSINTLILHVSTTEATTQSNVKYTEDGSISKVDNSQVHKSVPVCTESKGSPSERNNSALDSYNLHQQVQLKPQRSRKPTSRKKRTMHATSLTSSI